MRLIIFLTSLFISSGLYSQWIYSESKNAFDGNYKFCYAKGKGSEYPYHKPKLSINRFEKTDNVNFYIEGAGYFPKGVVVLIKFDNSDLVYKSYNHTFSGDSETIFLDEFTVEGNSLRISQFEMFQKLQQAQSVSIRVENDYRINDLKFSLSGSTNAINYVVGKEKLKTSLLLIKEQREVNSSLIQESESNFNKIFTIAKNAGIKEIEEDYSVFTSKLKNDLGIGYLGVESFKGYDIDSIVIKERFVGDYLIVNNDTIGTPSFYVDVFYKLKNGDLVEIEGTYEVEENSKVVKEFNRKLDELLVKYSSLTPLKNFLKQTILEYKFDRDYKLDDIVEVNVKFYNCLTFCYTGTLKLNLKNDLAQGDFKSIEFDFVTSGSSLKLKESWLADIGGKEDVYF